MIAGARLEPLGGADRGADRRAGARGSCSAPYSSSAFLAGVGLAGLVARLSGAAGAPGRQRRRSDALEWYPPGGWCCGPRSSARWSWSSPSPISAPTPKASAPLARRARGRPARGNRYAGDAPLAVPGVSNADRLVDFLVAAMPPAAAVLATITNVFNLWLAARVVKFSGRLKRPWPELAAMTFPRICCRRARRSPSP